MSRTIHALASTPIKTLAVVETASRGSLISPPVRLSMVVVNNQDLEQLFARRVIGNPNILVLETYKVPAGWGEGSLFQRRLDAMRKSIKERIRLGPIATCDYPIRDPGVLNDYRLFVHRSSESQGPGALETIHLMDPETGIVDTLEGWKQTRASWPTVDQRGRSPTDRWYALQEIVWVEEPE